MGRHDQMVKMTIQVPESLAQQVSAARERLPEVLAYGLEELSPLPNEVYRYILEFLISQPSAKELLDFGPTPAMQERVNELLEKNRAGDLTSAELTELDEYMRINHFITMLKARILPYLPSAS
jgi:hypothetical protein